MICQSTINNQQSVLGVLHPLILAFLTLLSISFNSCEAEDSIQIKSPTQQIVQTSIDINCNNVLSQVVKVDNKLKVIDGEHLKNVCDCLESIIDDYDDTVLNVEENQPIIDFESNLYFNSLRARIESDIIQWENDLVLNTTMPDPEDKYLAPITLLALVNEDCEMLVGDGIFNICDNPGGSILNFEPADFDDETIVDERTWCPGSNCCATHQELRRVLYPNNSDRRVKVSVFSYGHILPLGGLFSTQGGKITTQRRRNNGSWRRSRQNIRIAETGGIARRKSNCTILDQINDEHPNHKKRRSRERTSTNLNLINWAFATNEICTEGSVRDVFQIQTCNM